MGFLDETAANPPAMKWEAVGEVHELTLTREPRKQQETDPAGKPRTFPSGDPRYEWLFIGTDENGEERTAYAGWKLQDALRGAFSKAGVEDVGPGVHLKIKRTADLPPSQKGHSPMKTYAAIATPAPKTVAVDDFGGESFDDGAPF